MRSSFGLIRAAWEGLRSVWLALGVVVLVFAAIEIGPDVHLVWKRVLRVFNPDGGKADWRADADAYADADWAKAYWKEYFALARVDWKPYVLWTARPAAGKFVTIEGDGRRHTWSDPQAAQSSPRQVWMFGGSTMFGMGARDDHTIPSLVARELAGVAPVRVTNFGQPGWVMAQSAIELAEELKTGRKPDLVIFYDGVNDVFSAMGQGAPGLPQNNDNRVKEFNLTGEERRGDLMRESVFGLLPRTMGFIKRLTGRQHDWPNPAPEEIQRRGQANMAYMSATADQIRALAKAYGFEVRFVLQPVLFSKAVKTAHEQRSAQDFSYVERPYLQAYDALRSDRAFGGHADFIDLSRVFDGRTDPVYVDYCHLGEGGNATIASAIARAVAPVLRQ